jgi:DNA processing protein
VDHSPTTLDLLRLTLVHGLGPVRIARLLGAFATPERVLAASQAELQRVKGIGPGIAKALAQAGAHGQAALDAELREIDRRGVRLVARGEAAYPPMLASIPDAPPLLYIRGELHPDHADRYPVAIVGSRRCTAYGHEQATRFAGSLANAGLTIVSGGARGIDTAAHRGALMGGGRTIVVQGCGLSNVYPTENATLYEDIIAGRGAIVSELPMTAPPEAENFPARNRIISGLSLGVIVIEAQMGSGSLITARQAVEEHGREVMAVPGRVDSPASQGTLDLLKKGEAALVVDPSDVLELLETPARHHFRGTHESRYAIDAASRSPESIDRQPNGSEASVGSPSSPPEQTLWKAPGEQGVIYDALAKPTTLDCLCQLTGLDAQVVQAQLTLLEVQGRIRQSQGLISRK